MYCSHKCRGLSKVVEDFAASFWRKVLKSDGCWEWTASCLTSGYGAFWNGSKVITAHRQSFIMAHGDIPDGLFVCHHCDNRKCVRPDHLFLGTNADNVADMVSKNRVSRVSRCAGVKSPHAKLNDSKVREMRSLALEGVSHKEISKRFMISHATANKVIRRLAWSHVD